MQCNISRELRELVAVTMTPELWLLASSVSGLFTFCRGEKQSVEEDIFVGILGHTGTPTKAKLSARADNSNAN